MEKNEHSSYTIIQLEWTKTSGGNVKTSEGNVKSNVEMLLK